MLYRFKGLLAWATLAIVLSTAAQAGWLNEPLSFLRGASAQAAPASGVTIGFTPGNAEEVVVRTIDSARQSIDLAAYSFTSKPIAQALLRAHKRGVQVRAVLDKSQRTERYSSAHFLANVGIPVRIDDRYAIMHNKFMVIDGKTVQTGSFNYTSSAARRNAENVIVLWNDPAAAAAYLKEWQRLWDESEPMAPRY